MNYIRRQQKEQYPGFTEEAVLEQYNDYLSMCKACNKNMQDELTYRPRELKRRHASQVSRYIKINDKFSQYLLPGKANRIISQEIIPETPFFLRHFFSQFLRQWNDLLIMFPLHHNPSVTAAPCHLPLHKGGFGAVQ